MQAHLTKAQEERVGAPQVLVTQLTLEDKGVPTSRLKPEHVAEDKCHRRSTLQLVHS